MNIKYTQVQYITQFRFDTLHLHALLFRDDDDKETGYVHFLYCYVQFKENEKMIECPFTIIVIIICTQNNEQ